MNAVNAPEDLVRKVTARANPSDNTVVITTVPYSSATKARLLADGFATAAVLCKGDVQSACAKYGI